MKNKGRLLFLLALTAASLLAGCASTTSPTASDSQTPALGQPASNIPWNRPEGWEGGGALGSAMGQ